MTRSIIDSSALYWATLNRFEFRLPGQCVLDCSHQGQCDDDVAYWVPKIKAQVELDNFPNKPTPDKIRDELREYGAWNETELLDDSANWQRLVWCAACNVSEENEPDCFEPLKG